MNFFKNLRNRVTGKLEGDLCCLTKKEKNVYLKAYEEFGSREEMGKAFSKILVAMTYVDGGCEDDVYDLMEEALDDFLTDDEERLIIQQLDNAERALDG